MFKKARFVLNLLQMFLFFLLKNICLLYFLKFLYLLVKDFLVFLQKFLYFLATDFLVFLQKFA